MELELICSCRMIFLESVDIWISSGGIQTFGYDIQILKDFHLAFHWVSKRIHVMWYTVVDWWARVMPNY